MADITIIVIEAKEARKNLKKLLPPQVRQPLDQAGLEMDMESNEQLREKQPMGFPKKFTVPEEVMVFSAAEDEPDVAKARRRKMKDINAKLKRKRVPGNTE